MQTPSVTEVSLAHRRNQANLRSALVGLAAERYRLKHNRWPEALANLVADGLLTAVPADPFDGQPLRYRILTDGVVIYSVSLDLADNGGNLNRRDPTRVGTDLGFRLWNENLRRQAP